MNKIFLLLLTLIFSVNVQAATYYVSPTGSDTTGAGTNGNPWLTLQKCIDVPLVAGVTACESNGSAICTGRGPTNWSDGDNILNSNPLFTDIITRVYTPTGSSPSLNVGINYAGRTVDADGISMSGTQDIGAYEYYTVNAPTLPSAVDTPADNGGQINIAWTVSTSVTVTAQKVYQGATPGGHIS